MRNEELKFCARYWNAPLRHAVRTFHTGTLAAQRGLSRRRPSKLAPLLLEIALRHQKKPPLIGHHAKSGKAMLP
jgi:hypothetical protein